MAPVVAPCKGSPPLITAFVAPVRALEATDASVAVNSGANSPISSGATIAVVTTAAVCNGFCRALSMTLPVNSIGLDKNASVVLTRPSTVLLTESPTNSTASPTKLPAPYTTSPTKSATAPIIYLSFHQ